MRGETNGQEKGRARSDMHRIGMVLLLLLLSYSSVTTLASAEEREFVLEPSFFGVDAKLTVQFDFPEFKGEEKFSQDNSDRIAAFATGWNRWKGTPKLREYDVLCYLPSLLGNPFKYVFFDVGKGISEFKIKGNRVYRDGVLYGAAVNCKQDFEEILPIASKLIYLYFCLDDDKISDVIASRESVFSSLRYLCTFGDLGSILPFLKCCPIEFFHQFSGESDDAICERKFSEYLWTRNCPLSVSTVNDVLVDDRKVSIWEDTDSSRLRFASINNELLVSGLQPELFPLLEGVILTNGLDVSSGKSVSRLNDFVCGCSKLRILSDKRNVSARATMDTKVVSNLISNSELEHLSLDYRCIPSGSRFESHKLTSLIVDLPVNKIQETFNTDSLEYLSTSSISSFQDLTRIPSVEELRVGVVDILRVMELPKLNIKRLHIVNANFTGRKLGILFGAMKDAEVQINSLNLQLTTIPETKESGTLRSLEVLSLSIEQKHNNPYSEFLRGLLPFISKDGRVVLMGYGIASMGDLKLAMDEPRIAMFSSRYWIVHRSNGVHFEVSKELRRDGNPIFALCNVLLSGHTLSRERSDCWRAWMLLECFRSITAYSRKRL